MNLAALRDILASLRPAGPDSFEALAALGLNAATGLQFRLSKSGSQQGTDGRGAGPEDSIGFECKRYTSDLDSNAVKVKVFDLQRRDDVELWVLCATREVSEQLAREVRDGADAYGLQVQIFDWTTTTGIPLLALLVSLIDPDQLETFLKRANVSARNIRLARLVLDDIRAEPGYSSDIANLKADLDVVNLGFASARKANAEWLVETLSDRQRAIDHLRQPLAPLDVTVPHRVKRAGLIGSIQAHMQAGTPPASLFLLGDEGVGKSWAPMDAWLELPDAARPMLLMLQAREMANADDNFDIIKLLAAAIAAQTRRHGNGMDSAKWERMVRRWFDTRPYRKIPLTVIVDGINQHSADWGRILGKLSRELEKRHARLIVSSRRKVFEELVRPRFQDTAVIDVPAWTPPERDEVLKAKGLNGAELMPSVAEALLNPRLLGIALRLFDGKTLLGMHELSKSLLLFEYLRQTRHDAAKVDDPREFTKRLTLLARNLLAATTPKERRRVSALDDLEATAEGRFFEADDDIHGRYKLSPDGLTLALAFAVLDQAREAILDDEDATAAIAALIEPISTIDDTAEVLMAAAHAEDSVGKTGTQVIAALLVSFVQLQNVDPGHAHGFAALARVRTDAYVSATEHVWLAHGALPENGQWLQAALSAIPSTDSAWPTVAAAIHRWLRYYADSYESSAEAQSSEESEYTERRRNAFTKRLAAITPNERTVLERLTASTGDIDALGNLCMELLAGRALLPFVPALLDWSLGTRLRQSTKAPNEPFGWLGRHNTVDWTATRDAMRALTTPFQDGGLSATGQGAVAQLLAFSGDPVDAEASYRAQLALYADDPDRLALLTASDEAPTEPADPRGSLPHDIDHLVLRFTQLKVDSLFATFGSTSEDHDFETKLAWVARAEPGTATTQAVEFLFNILHRDGMALRQGVFASEYFALAMPLVVARSLIELRHTLDSKASALSRQDREAMDGECILVAFPQLSGDEQLTALLRPAPSKVLWIQHGETFKDASVDVVETAAAEALGQRGRAMRRHLLGFMDDTNSPVTPSVELLVREMASSRSRKNRVSAFSFLVQRGSGASLMEVVSGAWAASSAADDTEAYFGSLVLVRAVELALVTAEAVAARLAPEAYSALALSSDEGARFVGDALSDYIERVALIDVPVPNVMLEVNHGSRKRIRDYIDVDEIPAADDEFPGRFAWTPEDYARQGRRERKHFAAFCKAIAEADIPLALRTLSLPAFARVATLSAASLEPWAERLMVMPLHARQAVTTTALSLIPYLADARPALAVDLYRIYAELAPLVSVSFDMAAYPLAAKVAWSAAASPQFAAIARQRLLDARNDEALQVEVIAAQAEGRTSNLLTFVDQLVASGQPARTARAMTILGFMDEDTGVESRLAAGAPGRGPAESARKHALKAYRANQWARHWLREILNAKTDADAYPSYVLLRECVDARYDLWSSIFADGSPHRSRLATGIRNAARRAAGRLAGTRKRTLFGQNIPDELFLNDTEAAVTLSAAS